MSNKQQQTTKNNELKLRKKAKELVRFGNSELYGYRVKNGDSFEYELFTKKKDGIEKAVPVTEDGRINIVIGGVRLRYTPESIVTFMYSW